MAHHIRSLQLPDIFVFARDNLIHLGILAAGPSVDIVKPQQVNNNHFTDTAKIALSTFPPLPTYSTATIKTTFTTLL